MKVQNVIVGLLLFVFSFSVFGCSRSDGPAGPLDPFDDPFDENPADEDFDGLLTFKSCSDLKVYMNENASGRGRFLGVADELIAPQMKAMDISESTGSGSAADDYSSTNIQVAGVDEADIIKNDGKFIYLVKGDTVRVIKAYPPSRMEELDKITFSDPNFYPREMYLDDDRLVVIGDSHERPGTFKRFIDMVSEYDYYGSFTRVYIFDIDDKADIKLFRKLSFEGNYSSSRKIDDTVYLIANKNTYRYSPIPLYEDSVNGEIRPISGCTDVRYIPNPNSTNYMIVAGIPIYGDEEISKEVVLGASGTVYASRENLYVVETKYSVGWRDLGERSERGEKSTVHKFALEDGDIDYEGTGEVPGHILNQFSMDEYEGYFRIATTKGNLWDNENKSENNLYILDENLDIVGEIEGIAPGEKIYSVRFMGDRAYMVTFKKVDPFFVIDVSNPERPKILGKLKIPGYSDYLHPYDENHIIGFGKEAVEASEEEFGGRGMDFAWYQGMKIAIFDVTDVKNPIEMHKIVIGDRGTDSALLRNHKALLFDKRKGILAFPVKVAKLSNSIKNDSILLANSYGDFVFQGAYVFDIDLEDGFKLRGKITHYDNNEVSEKAGYYWYGERDINRILYMGKYFYTVSNSVVMANDMRDLDEEGRVEFDDGYDYRDDDYIYY